MIVNPGGSMEAKKGALPVGGTAGQILAKKSAEDYDAKWQDAPKTEGIPSGLIAMWSGAVNNIPSGWILCNGSNGTPDLRDRFIVGAGSSYGVGSRGGSEKVALNITQIPYHKHQYRKPTLAEFAKVDGSGEYFWKVNGTEYEVTTSTGGSTENPYITESHENRPPYYALCFIMKQ